MQNEWWMRPALQKSEAVLLPALPRTAVSGARFSQYFAHVKASSEPFRPVSKGWEGSTALSTYVRPRGSMAGRGVLRAAGVSMHPFASRPAYAGCRAGLRSLVRR